MRSQSIFAASFLLASTSLSFAQDVTFEKLLDEMVDRDELVKTPAHSFKLVQSSSYERTGGTASSNFANADGGGSIRTEDVNGDGTAEKVIMDASGPGAIVRFWSTFLPGGFQNGTIRFYFNGSTTPTIEAPFLDVISGTHLTDGILSARTGNFVEADRVLSGVNLYLPIPYSNGCIVTYEGTDNPFYYAINYREYDNSVSVSDFTMADLTTHSAKIDSVEAELETNATDVTTGTSLANINGTTIPAGGSTSFTINDVNNLDGEAIRQLKAKLSADDYKQALRSTIIDISFDGVQKVWAPIGDFFCSGYQIESEFEGRYHKLTDDGTMTSSWIMPFQTSAEITIRNLGSQDVTLDTFEANHNDWTWDLRSQYFHTGWHNEFGINSFPRRDLNYVTIEGSGTYVGDSLSIYNGVSGFEGQPWWGEGDEKIYIDGETEPSHFGTGTEDYYGYAWVGAATFEYPFLAQPIAHGNRDTGLTVNSRWRILDGIPFNTSLRLDMEIWHWNGVSIDYAPTTFWYGAAATREIEDLTANPTVAFPKDTAGATNPVRFVDLHEAESLKFTESADISATITTEPNNSAYRNRTYITFGDIDADESLSTTFYSDSARTGNFTITGTKSGGATVELLLNGNLIVSDFTGTVTLPSTDLVEGVNTLVIRGATGSGSDASLLLDVLSLNESNAAIAIMGTNDVIDSTLGTSHSQQGQAAIANLVDDVLGTDGDTSNITTTFGGDNSSPANGYLGVIGLSSETEVTGVSAQLACFLDGGWFGPNGASPGAGNALASPDHLTVPTVQVTADNGTTWTNVTSTANDYLSVMTGALIGGGSEANPRYYTVTFPLDTPQSGINGIRLIGPEGGNVDAGFVAAAEFNVQSPAPPEVVTVHSGTLADAATAAIDTSDWEVGETWYFQYTNDGPNNGNNVSGLGLMEGATERVFIGDGNNSGTPWLVTGAPNMTSSTPAIDGSSYNIILGITRGATDATNTYNFYVNPNTFNKESRETPTFSGTLANFNVSALTQVRTISNQATIRDIVMYTNGANPFQQPGPAEVVTVHSGTLADGANAAINTDNWAVGETWYLQFTNDGPDNGNNVSGLGLFEEATERVFIGDGTDSATPWMVTGPQNLTSATPAIDGSTFTIVIGITRGATTDANSFNLYVNPNVYVSELGNTPTFSGSLNDFNVSELTQVRTISNQAIISDIIFYTNSATPFGQTPPNEYAFWIDNYNVGGLTGFDDDFDGDTLGNGIENFFGSDPSSANSGISAVTVSGSQASFSHSQNATAVTDLTAEYEWSADLSNWNDSGDTVNGTTVNILAATNNPSVGTTIVTATSSGTPVEKLFFRVKVTQN